MSNPYILELKEVYDQTKITNDEDDEHGVFQNTLRNPIPITSGTTIQLRQAFIDTVEKNSQKIQLERDLPVSLTVCRYFTNNIENAPASINTYYSTELPNANAQQPDGFDYFECKFSGAVNRYKVSEIYLQAYGSSMKPLAGVHGTFSYNNPTGGEQRITLYFPAVHERDFTTHGNPAGLPSGNFHHYDFDFDTTDGILRCLNLDDLHDKHVHFGDSDGLGSLPWIGNPSETTTGGNAVDLLTDTYSFTIPANLKGYDPAELARLITDNLSDLGETTLKASNKYFTSSPLENSKTQDVFLKKNSDCSTGGQNHFFINSNGSVIAERKTGGGITDFYVGASQVALEWSGEEGVEAFKWTAIHTPRYDSSNASKAFVVEVKEVGGGANKFYMTGREGGVVFTSMEPANFWFDKLGFSSSILVSPPTVKKPQNFYTNAILNDPQGVSVPNLEGTNGTFIGVQNGLNTTENFRGLDSVIVAGQGNRVANPPTTIKSTTSTTNAIFGRNPFTDLVASDGYFLIEVDLGIDKTNYFGVNNLNYGSKVKGIISRYYSTDTYTSSNVEASIPFVYEGLPTKISQARVRILNSTGEEISNDIGEDNSVFLEIIPPQNSKEF